MFYIYTCIYIVRKHSSLCWAPFRCQARPVAFPLAYISKVLSHPLSGSPHLAVSSHSTNTSTLSFSTFAISSPILVFLLCFSLSLLSLSLSFSESSCFPSFRLLSCFRHAATILSVHQPSMVKRAAMLRRASWCDRPCSPISAWWIYIYIYT